MAIDRLQPVAVSFTPAGAVIDVRSWTGDAPPAGDPAWPTRQFATIDSGRILVQDLVTGGARDAVEIWLTPSGHLDHALAGRAVFPPEQTMQRRLWSATAPTRTQIELGWSYGSTLEGFRWSAEVRLDRGGVNSSLSFAAPASILAFCTMDADHAAVCVQRADKRPWPFCPPVEVHTLHVGRDGLVATRVPDLEITDRCWPARPTDRDDRLRMQQELAQYMSYSIGQYASVRDYGARGVELTVRDGPTGLGPTIDIAFSLDSAPGRRFRRRDVPFDELGNPGSGLRDMNVSLVEDLRAGLALSRASAGFVDSETEISL